MVLVLSISILGVKKYSEYCKMKRWKIRNTYKIKFKLENKTVILNAFLDTGNMLKEMLSGESVIVVSEKSIEKFISKKIIVALMHGNFENIDFSILKNIRPIVYSGIDATEKIMYGIKIKNIEIFTGETKIINDAIIVISNIEILNADALIGIGLLEGGYQSGDYNDIKTKDHKFVC